MFFRGLNLILVIALLSNGFPWMRATRIQGASALDSPYSDLEPNSSVVSVIAQDSQGTQMRAASINVTTINVTESGFLPAQIDIMAGETVIWTKEHQK